MSDDILFDCETCDAAGRIAALEAENDKLLEERHELKNELAKWLHYWRDKDLKAVEAENEKLRAALKNILPDYVKGWAQDQYSEEDAMQFDAYVEAFAALKETE